MTPDPATAAFLQGVKAGGGKPSWQLTPDEFRTRVRAASLQLAPPSVDVHAIADVRMAVSGGDIGLRIYTPRSGGADRPWPILVHYHGAGFVAGDLDTHDGIARSLCAQAGVIVIAVDYRLAPEHPFPAAVDDAYAAVEWAVGHAREHQGDQDRIAVIGDSAGGNLAAVVCQLAKLRHGPPIAFQALIYPVVDFRLSPAYPSGEEFGGGEFFLSTRDMEFFRSLYLPDAAKQQHDPRASPLLAADLGGLPPALIVTAGCDPLRDEDKAYADRLAAAGVPVEYRCFESTIHAFISFAAAIPVGMEALSFVASRVHAALNRPPVG
jgi:acetyl esterase/lipase